MFERIREQKSENQRHSWGFSLAREFSQTLPRCSPGLEGTENIFYFFYKIISFRLFKEKDEIRNVRWPKSITANSICSRQFQFENFFLNFLLVSSTLMTRNGSNETLTFILRRVSLFSQLHQGVDWDQGKFAVTLLGHRRNAYV